MRRKDDSSLPVAKELRNAANQQELVQQRLLAMAMLVLLCFALLTWRWVVMQVVRHKDYIAQAENNRTATVPITPSRGDIVDRNGIVLATNYTAYTLELTPNKMPDVQATIDQLAQLVTITPADRKRFRRLQADSRSYEPIPLRSRLSDEEIARIATQLYRLPGVEVNARPFRYYPYGELASHVIGYIGRINQKEKDAIQDSEDGPNYRGTDHIGKLGIEQSYETELHGTSGSEQMETTAGGFIVRRLSSTPAVPGKTVVLSIDIRLQKLVEDLFGSRRGALVAIDPRDGQILAFVSKPTFDPNLFVDGIDQDSWQALNDSADKPLLNRALRGTYPPGSTYKPFMALAALETGKRKPGDTIYDPGYWIYGNHRFRSPEAGGLGMVNLARAITMSSNVYFYILAHDMGVDAIHDFMAPLGFGQRTGIDLQGEARGVLPSQEWKRKTFKRPAQQRWLPGETISLGIGQGYNNFTMLQVSHALATMVNGGNNYQPRVALALQDAVSHQFVRPERNKPVYLGYKPENVQLVKNAMVNVTVAGTSRMSFSGAGYVSGGKTGTAQAVTLGQHQRYSASAMSERKRDHSLYEAFAPADHPTIALAVIVENAGFGATAAAPIARRVLDYWIKGLYPSEADIEAVSHGGGAGNPGGSRPVATLPWPPAGMKLLTPVRNSNRGVTAISALTGPSAPALTHAMASSGAVPPAQAAAAAAPGSAAAPSAAAASGAAPQASAASAPPPYAPPPAALRLNQLFLRLPGQGSIPRPVPAPAPSAPASGLAPETARRVPPAPAAASAVRR